MSSLSILSCQHYTYLCVSEAQAEASVASTEKEEPSSSVSDVDPEKDSSRYMAVLVESLSMLGRVQDALDVRTDRQTDIQTYKQSFVYRLSSNVWRKSFF